MQQHFDNTLACVSWLKYVNLQGPQELLGPVTENVVKAALAYEVGIPYMSYIAEFPLLGKAGVDLSAVYYLRWFRNKNIFGHHPAEVDGEFLKNYAGMLDAFNFHLVDESSVFLEADSSKDVLDSYGLFIVLAGNCVSKLLSKVLLAQRLDYCLPKAKEVLHKVKPFLELWYLGFMHSRPREPLRLSLVGSNEGLKEFLVGARCLGLTDFLTVAEPLIYQLEALKLFKHAYLSLDILKDGSLGDVVGLDLQPQTSIPSEQNEILASKKYQKLYHLLQNAGLADKRIEQLPACAFSNSLSGPSLGNCELHSFLSHLKLRWRGHQPLPAKAYLQMHTSPVRQTINDMFF